MPVTTPTPSVADSVRLALPAEAGALTELQRRAWSMQLPAELSAVLLAELTADEATEIWHHAITRPPLAQYRVLVAVEQHRLVGFASIGPSTDPDARDGRDGLIDEFLIDPPAQRRGHGSRLLHACVDTLRADGFTRATWWLTSTDDLVRAFLTEAGWAADGGRREVATEDDSLHLKQVRMHTDISDGRPVD